jgi:hypothetical protein
VEKSKGRKKVVPEAAKKLTILLLLLLLLFSYPIRRDEQSCLFWSEAATWQSHQPTLPFLPLLRLPSMMGCETSLEAVGKKEKGRAD